MAIRSVKTGLFSRSMLVGNSYYVPLAFESINTITLTSNQTSIEFTSIPSTYQHLQIRYTWWPNSSGGTYCDLRFNGDSTATNYYNHAIGGNGTTVTSGASADAAYSGENGETASACVGIIDILDYANTNKNKVVRELYGYETNSQGRVYLNSNLWKNTSVITSIRWDAQITALATNSIFALYGIKVV